MKRLLVAGAGALMLSACGGGGEPPVGANSSDSTEITAVGTIVGNQTPAASGDNATAVNAAASVPDTAVPPAATDANAVDDVTVASNSD